jgi:hypothetical protein
LAKKKFMSKAGILDVRPLKDLVHLSISLMFLNVWSC